MPAAKRITVAGAGAIGLTTALALARAGFEVVVHDPAAAADNASGVAAGMLAPAFESLLDPVSATHFELLRAARDLWPALAAEIGLALDRQGAAFVGEAAQVEDHARGLERLGLSPQRLGRPELARLAPGLAPGLVHGVLTDADWRLDAPLALAALRSAGRASGVSFQASPAPLARDGLLVVATGASMSLAATAPELAALTPIKGHILRLAAEGFTGPVLRGEGVYLAPSGRGLIVGATMEPGVADTMVDAAKARDLLAAGARLAPAIGAAAFTAATGLRAATPDGLPLAGWSATPGVLVAVGARRNGWLLAPLIAQVIVDCLAGEAQAPYRRRFWPGRFASQA